MRGPGGGYLLAHDRDETRIADIILAVDEPIAAARCTPGAPVGCRGDRSRCLTHDLWEELGNQIHLYLSSVSLGDVCERRVLGTSVAPQRGGVAQPRRLQARDERPAGHHITVLISVAPAEPMTRRETYLDWNATAPLRPEAVAAIVGGAARMGQSVLGASARAAPRGRPIERAREAVAALVGDGDRDGVIFVSGGTEANHLALLGGGRDRVLVSAVEHDSVLQAVPDAEAHPGRSRRHRRSRRARRGCSRADPRPALVSVMLANNETGDHPAGRARSPRSRTRHGALFHCDAVQAAGKIAARRRRDRRRSRQPCRRTRSAARRASALSS